MSGRRRSRSRSRSPKRSSTGDRDRRRSPERSSRSEKREVKRDDSPESSFSLLPPTRRGDTVKKERSPQGGRPPRERRRSPSPEGYGRESERYGKPQEEAPHSPKPTIPKEKPDFKPSGKLAAVNKDGTGPALKWGEPPEARLPTKRWRLYVFKDNKTLDPYYIHRQSAYLFGRDRLVVDIPLDHPSCSKQHSVLQYRLIEREDEEGDRIKEVKPYIIDLGSTNGTFLNGERIDDSRYYELRESDVLKFGLSTREFVLLHELSADDDDE